MNIGQEKDFYKLKNLSKDNINLINMLFIKPTSEYLQELNKGWITLFEFVFKAKDFAERKGINSPELDLMLDEYTYNLEEDLHTSIEHSSIKYLDAILNEDISFYDKDSECIEFIHFICVQYMRTNNIKQSVLAGVKSISQVNLDEIWNVVAHILATNMGWSLYSDRRNLKLILLKNETEIKFITGDQPIINTYATDLPVSEPPTELEFYYPASPSLAVLLTNKGSYVKGEKVSLSSKDVEEFNTQIVKQSHSQIYSSSRNCLEYLQ